jgi:cytochrome c oxidase assembly factor CtaG
VDVNPTGPQHAGSDTRPGGEPGRESRRESRRPRGWLAALAVVLVVASLVPPLDVLARRYLFAESIQFCVFALAAPVLVVLAAPWSLFPRGLRRLAGVNESGRGRPPSAAAGYLIAWVAVCVAWRLPPVLDGLARHPVLAVPEAVTAWAAGIGLWLELIGSPPLEPRLTRPQRATVAALAMWSIWVIAYVLGFARDSVVHAYDGAGSHLVTVDDQEITAFVLFAAAAVAFLPVVFTAALTWLRDGSEPGQDGSQPAAELPDRALGTPAPGKRPQGAGQGAGHVRGWGRGWERPRATGARDQPRP